MSEAVALLEVREPSARYLASGAPSLIGSLGLATSAPGAVEKLRALVLSLAVRGRLTSQNTADEPASRLLAAMGVAPLTDGPFVLPSNWAWASLGSVVEVIRGITFPASEKTREPGPNRVACLRTTNVQRSVEWGDLLFINRSFVARTEQFVRHHDIVMSMANSRELVGKVALIDQIPHPDATFGGFLGVLRPREIQPRYVMAVLCTEYARSSLIDSASQTTNIANISLAKLRPLPIPVPPLAEQHRIVARVEELMKLCDALEAQGRLADEQHARLTTTLFGLLAASESPQALAENWQRIAEHFDLLLDRPEAIDALEQTILQLAVRGQLVPHRESEGSGGALLARHRLAACAAGQRTRAQLTPVEEDDAPFAIAPSWAWARCGEVADVSGGVTLGRKGALAQPLTLPYLRVANVQRGHLNLAGEVKTVTIDAHELPRFQLKPGDLLITEGGDWDKVGRTCTWRGEIATCLHQNHVFKARGWTSEWLPAWGELYLNSADARSYFAASAKQTTNLASINMTELRHCAFPLPPLAEQHRIVARVDELRRLCAQLRERLVAARQTQTRLADALVAQAVA